jgi:hypothetical protein
MPQRITPSANQKPARVMTDLVSLLYFSEPLAETYQLNMPISWLNLTMGVYSAQNIQRRITADEI